MRGGVLSVDPAGRAPARAPGRAGLATGVAAGCVWLVTVFALILFCSPALTNLLQFDRAAIARGELWRVVTGHWTHWSFSHLAWDLAAFIALGIACIHRRPRATAWTLAIGSLAIGAAVWFWQPHLSAYRGMSGLDAALFALLAVDVLMGTGLHAVRAACAAVLLCFLAKLDFELMSGRSFFVDSAAAGFVPVPLAHAVGAAVGAVVAFVVATPASPRHQASNCQGHVIPRSKATRNLGVERCSTPRSLASLGRTDFSR
jgi:rhomboid family GlyGly-CTERM serine protease